MEELATLVLWVSVVLSGLIVGLMVFDALSQRGKGKK